MQSNKREVALLEQYQHCRAMSSLHPPGDGVEELESFQRTLNSNRLLGEGSTLVNMINSPTRDNVGMRN